MCVCVGCWIVSCVDAIKCLIVLYHHVRMLKKLKVGVSSFYAFAVIAVCPALLNSEFTLQLLVFLGS